MVRTWTDCNASFQGHGGRWEDFCARRERLQVERIGSLAGFPEVQSVSLRGSFWGASTRLCSLGCRGGCPEPSTFTSFGKRAALVLTIPGWRVGGTQEHSFGGWELIVVRNQKNPGSNPFPRRKHCTRTPDF